MSATSIYLLMAAQAEQESTLGHCVRRRFAAIGVMQVMPATGVFEANSFRSDALGSFEPDVR